MTGAEPEVLAAGDDDTGTFGKLVDAYARAWSSSDGRLDEAAVARLYADEPGLVFYDAILPESFGSAAEMLAHGRELFAGLTSMALAPGGHLHVRRYGAVVAWTAATIELDARTKDGQRIAFPMRQTAIWQRRGDAWLIVHEHVSAPIGSGAPRPETPT